MRACRVHDRAVGGNQSLRVRVEPRRMPPMFARFRNDALGDRETFRMLLEPFDAEQFCSNRFRQPRNRVSAPERIAKV